ncbi:MAG: 3-dehydroquinate synthase [Clostridia bacterium]|nr:3-dehydroquinate synthase [Clostridia bacterium]
MKNYKTVTVNTGKSYPIFIGENLINSVGELISSLVDKCKIAVITDDTVDALFGDKVMLSLKTAGYVPVKFVFKHGEESKNLSTYANAINFLAENELTRTDAVLALGGGVVGDLAGFVSATYLRGIKYIQVPTTLLSATDSSVGGKTAVDIPSGKNLVGAFCQPSVVVCDSLVIKNLPKTVFNDGMGEVLKYALLDEKVFSLIENGDYDLTDLIYLCVDYKRKIVEIDEFEKCERRLLNLGHTPAHAIEKLSNYTVTHGNAVATGVKIMVEYSFNEKILSHGEYARICKVMEKFNITPCSFSAKELALNALNDKKRSGENIKIIVVNKVGDCGQKTVAVSSLEKVFYGCNR